MSAGVHGWFSSNRAELSMHGMESTLVHVGNALKTYLR